MNHSLTPQEFVNKWRHAELKERSACQQHFLDLCRLIDHPAPADIDPKGDFYTFEAGASKVEGGDGFADVWFKGHFAWEYKGKHANLDKAYQQLLQYREALQNPPLLIVSDIDSILIHTNFTNTVKQVYTLTLDDLLTSAGLAKLEKAFRAPDALRSAETSEGVTQKAAAQFARLAEVLRKTGQPNQRIAHFLIRLLFCLFAEDVGLLPARTFTSLVRSFRNHPQTFTRQLSQLFDAMSTGGAFGMDLIPHFDGRLFDDAETLELGSDGLDILYEGARLDWGNIEPSIFGTLFERGLDPSKRSQLGAHYTAKEDILLIVEPVLIAPLRREWQDVRAAARALADRRDAASGRQRGDLQKKLTALLLDFSHKIAALQVLDPACGSGNFLYVALRQLLDLQKEVIVLAGSLQVGQFFPTVSPAQLHGIEVNEYAHQLAQATIQIGYIQWLRENGFGAPGEPILKPLDNIALMDAILAYDPAGKPCEPVWPTADVIIGNPPFLGDKKMRAELGDKYVEDLRNLYRNRIPGQSDLVCYWFEKARFMLETKKVERAGLLATQGIRGGANRTVLDRIKDTGNIYFAYSDRNWILDGATVHVSMIGFDDGSEKNFCLDGNSVNKINPDLTSVSDLTSAKILQENSGLSFIGTQKGGNFDLHSSLALEMLADKGNPNRKPNSDVVVPWINALDITGRPRNYWVIDFGENMEYELASLYQKPFEYVLEKVKPVREKVNSEERTTQKWWLYQRPRPDMRRAIAGLSRFIVTPMVSKHRIFAWVKKGVIPENLLVVIARDDDYMFGVLHSTIHELWSRRKGTQLREAESGQRYTPTTTFETFPFPWPPGTEPPGHPLVQAIAAAARQLVEKRDAWLNPPGASAEELKKRTLTNLYNQRPTWLQLAHQQLDRAVFAAYNWPETLTDDQILENLLALNLHRAAAP